uniref:Uncharacterized protein n=1 Tax=Glossina brevipalpis TaxID=37001 RepID=A0A1A9WR55_9MUSC
MTLITFRAIKVFSILQEICFEIGATNTLLKPPISGTLSYNGYIETSEGGLVIISINEGDGGRYDSYLDGTLLCSYSVNVDAHRCTPPSKKNDYQKIYSHWCNEFEKYKSAMKQWQAKQEQCNIKEKSNGKHLNEVYSNDNIISILTTKD